MDLLQSIGHAIVDEVASTSTSTTTRDG
jgi:hypothetical protein